MIPVLSAKNQNFNFALVNKNNIFAMVSVLSSGGQDMWEDCGKGTKGVLSPSNTGKKTINLLFENNRNEQYVTIMTLPSSTQHFPKNVHRSDLEFSLEKFHRPQIMALKHSNGAS